LKTISLDGIWKASGFSGVRRTPEIEMTVPGTVQEAYIPIFGPIEEGHNCLSYRWIEEELWRCEREFELPELEKDERVRLVFEGLDLTASILLNSVRVGSHNNYYLPCRCDVTSAAKSGTNKLVINIESGLKYAAQKPVGNFHPAPSDHGLFLHNRPWLRKPQSFFEWDWSPRLIPVGIHKGCRVEIGRSFFDQLALQTSLSDGYGEITAHCFTSGCGDELTLKMKVSETGEEFSVTAAPDANGMIALTGRVPSPRLWWPVGKGEQNLYTLEFSLCDKDSEIAAFTRSVGFRTAVIERVPRTDVGETFILNVNGRRVFAKGANFIPGDLLPHRMTREDYETLIDRALECGFNCLRVWGGGLYETEDFYELCDRKGVLVWQDCIGACAGYPGSDPEFYKSFKAEAEYNLRRMASHPSLAVLCGNNEIEWNVWSLENTDLEKYPDAVLWYFLIPRILKAEGIDCYYQPSSPWSPDMSTPNGDFCGDQHPWGIGFADKNYYGYRSYACSFPNEGGVLGSVSLPDTLRCFGNEAHRTFDREFHDNSIGQQYPQTEALRLISGKDPESFTLEEYVYYAGLYKAEGLTEYILNFRRRKYNSAAAIFWMFNSCWPAFSCWTVVDSLKNRTPAFYPVRRAMSEAAVDIVSEDGVLTVYGINDTDGDLTAGLEYGTFTPEGDYVSSKKQVLIPADSSLPLAVIEPREGAIPFAELKSSLGLSRRRYLTDSPAKYSGDASISVTVEGDTAVYLSDRFVTGVCIDLDGKRLSDNMFDLFPNRPYTVRLCGNSPDVLFSL